MEIIKRLKSPTPNFFKKVRNWGLTLAAISGSVLAVPEGILPDIMVKAAGYLAVAGAIASATSQTASEKENEK